MKQGSRRSHLGDHGTESWEDGGNTPNAIAYEEATTTTTTTTTNTTNFTKTTRTEPVPVRSCPTASSEAKLEEEASDGEQEEDPPFDAEAYRRELRDHFDWDLGVAATLYWFKQLQIHEQWELEIRQQRRAKRTSTSPKRNVDSVRRSIAAGPDMNAAKRRLSVGDIASGSNAPAPNAKPALLRSSCRSDKASRMLGGLDFAMHEDMRTKSRRALFEGLASTADMSRDRWYVVSPSSSWRRAWIVLLSAATITTVTISPMLACGVAGAKSGCVELEALCDAIFGVDMILTFLTAYQDEVRDIVVTSPQHIRKRYVRSWFVLDLITVLPFDYILRLTGHAGAGNVLRMVKLVRIYRLANDSSHHIDLGDTTFNPSLASLLRMLASLLLMWHWTACVFNFMCLGFVPVVNNGSNVVVNAASSDEFDPEREWVVDPRLEAGSADRYFHLVSWAIGVTLLSHRPIPQTLGQLLFGDSVAILGFLATATITASATAAISELQSQASENARALQAIARYMRRKHLPRDVRRRVLSFYRFQQKSMNILSDETVLVGLPTAMRLQISLIMHKPIFVQLPLFWLCSEEEMLLIAQRLKPCIVMPGEMLVCEGTLGVGLFLLMKGGVEITREGKLLVVLLAVAAFGETALTSEEPSDVTVRALRFCEASILLREDWAIVEALNPRVRTWLEIYVNERDRKLKDETVQKQSLQTKKATLRCGGCGEWTELTASAEKAAHHRKTASGTWSKRNGGRKAMVLAQASQAFKRRASTLGDALRLPARQRRGAMSGEEGEFVLEGLKATQRPNTYKV